MRCLACQAEGTPRIFAAREMMFGWRHRFEYAECLDCGTLHLTRTPPNLADYYPAEYGSLVAPAGDDHHRTLRAWFGRWLVETDSPAAGRMARMLARKFAFLQWARLTATPLSAAILDVGCGSGGLLRRMRRWGFTRLKGVDPFAPAEIDVPGFQIVRGELTNMTGHFDLIMLHHVLEHLPDPIAALRLARERLRPTGRVLVRIPLAASRAARTYGPDWLNLDAPRHLVIPSLAGFRRIAHDAGFTIQHEEFDADESSFTLSECYRCDVPMAEANGRISGGERRRYRRLAQELNRNGDADRGVFVLTIA